MTNTSVHPIAFEIRDVLRSSALFGASVSVNEWEGFDFRSPSGHTLVRVALDDETVGVYRFTGRNEMLQSKATFTWTPASVIAGIVSALLAIELGE